MRAVDTNVLVRLMTRDDSRQVALAEAFVARGAWVPQLAIAEATWVLASVYDRDADAIATAVEMLLSHEHLTVQDTEVVAASVVRFRERPSVGFSDCLMIRGRAGAERPCARCGRDGWFDTTADPFIPSYAPSVLDTMPDVAWTFELFGTGAWATPLHCRRSLARRRLIVRPRVHAALKPLKLRGLHWFPVRVAVTSTRS